MGAAAMAGLDALAQVQKTIAWWLGTPTLVPSSQGGGRPSRSAVRSASNAQGVGVSLPLAGRGQGWGTARTGGAVFATVQPHFLAIHIPVRGSFVHLAPR